MPPLYQFPPVKLTLISCFSCVKQGGYIFFKRRFLPTKRRFLPTKRRFLPTKRRFLPTD